jgi:hypothetical protein
MAAPSLNHHIDGKLLESSKMKGCFINGETQIRCNLSGFSDFNFLNFAQNLMPAALWCQSQLFWPSVNANCVLRDRVIACCGGSFRGVV